MSASNDGSEDVDQFLARIASLSKKSGSEDAERTRRTEEQLMQAKKERQARRAERARSLSPSKTGPAAPLSSPSSRSPIRQQLIDPPVSLEPQPRPRTPAFARPESPTRSESIRPPSVLASSQTRPLPQPPQQSQEAAESPNSRPSSSAGLSRSGTLSWQQRPLSRGIGSGFGSVRSRPLSGSRAASREPPESPREDKVEKLEETPSREDIAASLGSRDPAWFRQTQERGLGSAAYRKSAHDDSTPAVHSPQGLKLPGMGDGKSGRDPISLPSRQAQEDTNTTTSSRSSSPRRNTAAAYVVNQGLTPSLPSLSSTDLSLEHPSSDSRRLQQDADNNLARSGSVLAGRPPSPTKGLGGFVQSAMMRRSDSVSKRWSVQASPGLKRGDSVAGNKQNFNFATPTVPALGHARTLSRDTREPRDGTESPQGSSRPTSSHAAKADAPSSFQKSQSEPHGLVAPSSNRASIEVPATKGEPRDDDPVLSRSPSKTLDPRRWSPTKASWLESALSKPESPRFSPTKEEAPPWKVDMQRSKSNKDLSEATKRSIPHEPVSTPSLLRSPPPTVKSKPLDLPTRTKVSDLLREGTSEVAPSTEKIASTPKEFVPLHTRREVTEAQPKESLSETTSIPETSKLEDPHKTAPAVGTDSFRSSIDRKPPALKPKPDTPPKTDFRATLKSRTAPTPKSNDEPEFKAVFGKLKKAQTQNYVAPDIFKENITRGNAGLNTTGGPQPRKRVDEFKESILAQKEAMQVGGGSIHKRSESRETSPSKPENEVPEALQRRNTLHRSKASQDSKPLFETKGARSPPPVAQSKPNPSWTATREIKPESLTNRSERATPREDAQTVATKPKDEITRNEVEVKPQAPTRFEPERAPARPAERHEAQAKTPVAETTVSQAPLQREKSIKTAQGTSRVMPLVRSMAASGSPAVKPAAAATGLAARLNPALAGLIARGSSPKPANDTSAQSSASTDDVLGSQSRSKVTESAENLTHMTKGRAKGPKRKAPKTTANAAPAANKRDAIAAVPTNDKEKSTTPSDTRDGHTDAPQTSPSRSVFSAARDTFTKSSDVPSTAAASVTPQPLKMREATSAAKTPSITASEVQKEDTAPEHTTVAVQKAKSPPPVVASKSPELRRVSGQPSPMPQKPETTSAKSSPKKSFAIATDNTTQKSSPAPPPKATASTNSPVPAPLTPSRSTAGLGKTMGSSGLGLKLAKTPSSDQLQGPTPPPDKTFHNTLQAKASNESSPIKRAITSVFPDMPRGDQKADFDTEAILSIKSTQPDSIRTISNQIWEVSADGKKNALPQQQEHVLFEDSLYLIVHTFESGVSARKQTECHLWTGDSVPASAVEDAQLFCRKIARENSAKLEVIKQGKESSNFFAALGGIVVFRRSKASALYMLCGRRHLGHVTFDEVDFAPNALCSGFPYLISAKFGKLYLWKGQGSGADEIGAARLIGMDLGLTGEIEEVAEGKEPAAFWECFSSIPNAKTQFKPSDIWAMRSMDEKKGFPCKLYRLEPERPKSSGGGFWGLRASSPSKESNKATLSQIEPFVQADLEESGSVHVLDAWASIYVIPGPKSKPADFVTALHIAQEMAVLTPSMQDRALLPSCEVVLGGVPSREARAAFRKYVVVPGQKEGEMFEVAEVLGALD